MQAILPVPRPERRPLRTSGTKLARVDGEMFDRIPRPVRVMAVLALFAFGFAMLANALFARLLAVDPARLAALQSGGDAVASAEPEGEGPGEAEPERASTRVRAKGMKWFMDPIVQRNLFDSTNALAGKKAAPDPDPDPEGEAQKSDIEAVLISTSPAYPINYSTALLQIQTEDPDVYTIGEAFLDAEIVAIRQPFLDRNGNHRAARIEFTRDGSLEYLEVGDKATKKSSVKKKGGDEKAAPKPTGRHTWDGIKKVGDNQYSVERAEVDYALGNLDKLSREARVVPNFQDGESNGFKVFSIRRNSALRKMGLKNNDVLTAVNGNSLSSPEKAMELYSKLLNDSSFELEVLRNGQPQTIRYDVQ